jgi:hypothetical protein
MGARPQDLDSCILVAQRADCRKQRSSEPLKDGLDTVCETVVGLSETA